MKRKTALVLLFTVVLIFSACSKDSKEQTPAVIKYENGWPTFSISYPSGWVNKPFRPRSGEVFAADAQLGIPSLRASVNANQPAPLKYFSRSVLPVLSNMGENFEIIEDKAVTLKDGTDAWETRLNWDLKNGPALSTLFLTVKKENMWITISLSAMKGKLTDELKSIPYSLEVYPGEEAPVDMPKDISRCIDEYTSAISSRDVSKIMDFFSDDYSKAGTTKSDIEKFYKMNMNNIDNLKLVITKCKPDGNKTFIAGYVLVSGNRAPFPGDYLARNEGGQLQWVGH